MDDISKEYIVSFFNRKLMMHKDRPETVGWSSTGQVLHYQSMLDIGDIRNSRVLDFGCGKGDFYVFLKEREMKIEYSGFDINAQLIGIAKQKHPGVDFRVFDLDKDLLNEDFDYIFLCGVFNLKVQGIEEAIRKTLIKLFSHCRKALAFNALSSHDPKKDFELNYLSPEDIFDFAVNSLSPHVVLRHDRIPYDFNMFVYRDINSLHTRAVDQS